MFSVLILLLTESHTLPLKCCSILKGVLLTDKKRTYFKDYHICLSFSYQLVPQTCPWAFVLSLETFSKLSSSLLVILFNDFFYQLIDNNNILNLTLPTKFSTTTLFPGYSWLQDSSSVTETWVSSSGTLSYLWCSTRKVYNLPAPSEYQLIHLGNTHTEAPMSPSSLTAMHFSLALTNRTLVHPQPFSMLEQTPFS